MAGSILLYYITDRCQFPGSDRERRQALLANISEAAVAGIDYVQLREKDLSTRDLEVLGREALSVIRNSARASVHESPATRLLINSRTDVALAVGADGVHLRSDDVDPSEVRKIWREAQSHISQNLGQSRAGEALIGVSCHSTDDVFRAASHQADFAVFAPVFEKRGMEQSGLADERIDALREACAATIPVIALGGVTVENANACIEAGAAGVAGIRLFQENRIDEVVRALRAR